LRARLRRDTDNIVAFKTRLLLFNCAPEPEPQKQTRGKRRGWAVVLGGFADVGFLTTQTMKGQSHFYPLSFFFRNGMATESEANPDPQEHLEVNSWVGLQK